MGVLRALSSAKERSSVRVWVARLVEGGLPGVREAMIGIGW